MDKQENSFIYHCFQTTTEIGVNVTTEMYLISHTGLLFYYIDGKRHQIIVNLKDEQFPIISVNVGNNNEQLIVFHEFCQCKSNSCSHEKLHFQFLIYDKFSIICNGNIANYSLVKSVKLNFDLPILVYKEINCACIWFINFRRSHENILTVFPNNEHLSGCFFYFKFGADLIPKKYDWPTTRCTVQCLPGICNGGECIETYHLKPNCNCSKSLLNGKFSLYSTSNHSSQFQFKILKVSWYSKSGIVLKIIDRNKTLSIYERENKIEIEFRSSEKKLTKEMPINVTKMSYRVLFLQLDGKEITAKLKNDKNELSVYKFEIKEDLSNDNFTLIDFPNSDNLKGDVVYASAIGDENWTGVKLYSNLTDDTPKNFKGNLYLLLLFVRAIIGIIAIIAIFLALRCLKKNTGTHERLSQKDNSIA